MTTTQYAVAYGPVQFMPAALLDDRLADEGPLFILRWCGPRSTTVWHQVADASGDLFGSPKVHISLRDRESGAICCHFTEMHTHLLDVREVPGVDLSQQQHLVQTTFAKACPDVQATVAGLPGPLTLAWSDGPSTAQVVDLLRPLGICQVDLHRSVSAEHETFTDLVVYLWAQQAVPAGAVEQFIARQGVLSSSQSQVSAATRRAAAALHALRLSAGVSVDRWLADYGLSALVGVVGADSAAMARHAVALIESFGRHGALVLTP